MTCLRLDLHRVRHENVPRIVVSFIEDHWNSRLEAEIITGNSPAMRKIVEDILKEYKLTYSIGRLFDYFNSGYIVVRFE